MPPHIKIPSHHAWLAAPPLPTYHDEEKSLPPFFDHSAYWACGSGISTYMCSAHRDTRDSSGGKPSCFAPEPSAPAFTGGHSEGHPLDREPRGRPDIFAIIGRGGGGASASCTAASGRGGVSSAKAATTGDAKYRVSVVHRPRGTESTSGSHVPPVAEARTDILVAEALPQSTWQVGAVVTPGARSLGTEEQAPPHAPGIVNRGGWQVAVVKSVVSDARRAGPPEHVFTALQILVLETLLEPGDDRGGGARGRPSGDAEPRLGRGSAGFAVFRRLFAHKVEAGGCERNGPENED